MPAVEIASLLKVRQSSVETIIAQGKARLQGLLGL